MTKKINIGIIREGKTPPDSRVPFTPQQCQKIINTYPNVKLFVQSAAHRCFADEEYTACNIPIVEEVSHCDLLLGVKEVPIADLISNKKYLFFSHTIKEQPYNQKLLQAIIAQKIQLIDYECLRWQNGQRILGFGRHAGIVGTHNGLLTYGKKTNAFSLKAAHNCKDFEEIKQIYAQIRMQLPPIKIVLTGKGRVGQGAKEVLDLWQIPEVSPADYLQKNYDHAVYTILDVEELYRRKEDNGFERQDFFQHPAKYYSIFEPYTKVTDVMINGVYWHPEAPIFFSKEAMRQSDFAIKVIADITCDIEGSIPATLRATKIGDAVLGYNPQTEQEEVPFQLHTIDIMSVDNLPNELPRDASVAFGETLIAHVLPELLNAESDIIHRASITKNGDLNPPYEYLRAYATGSEAVSC